MKLDLRLLISFFAFFGSLVFFSSLSEGATVKKRVLKKRIIQIDAGTKDGFTKGSSVCFLDKGGSEIGCGKVTAANASKSHIKVSKALLRKIKVGDSAMIEGSASTIAMSEYRTNIKALYLPSIIPAITYNRIGYAPTSQSQAAASLWDAQGGAYGIAPLGFGTEFEFAIGKSMSLAVGGRYRINQAYEVDSSYDLNDGNTFARARIEASSMGAWADFYFLELGKGPIYFRMFSGLDLDMSSLSLVARQLHDSEDQDNPLFDVTSSLSALSLRFGGQMNFYFKPIGLTLSAVPMVPVADFSRGGNFNVDDPNYGRLDAGDGDVDVRVSEDFFEKLNHNRTGFGLELAVGMYYAF